MRGCLRPWLLHAHGDYEAHFLKGTAPILKGPRTNEVFVVLQVKNK